MIGYIGLGVGIIAAVALGYLIGRIPRTKKEEEIIASAQEEAERLKRERILEARQEIQEMREEFEARTKRREEELARMEERILQREDRLGKKSTYLERIEDSLRADEEELQRLKEEGERLLAEEKAQLARISGWTEKEAQEHLLKLVETESQRFFSRKVEEVERRAKEEAQQRAARILATAVQRYAGEY
ncbi:MAG TPA: DUF3552 domain-containing protein, partial [Candidatus Acetothermia bacterium]|nr:DUF3552 domain-containing protein [Candidatus Acetothermia bacterium]